MKKICVLIFVCMSAFLFLFTVQAKDDYYSNAVNDVLEEADETTKSLLDKLNLKEFTTEEIRNISFHDIADLLLSIFKGSLKKPLTCLAVLTGIAVICSVAACYIENKTILQYFEIISVIFVILITFSDIADCINRTVTSLESVGTLMKILIPAIAAIAAFSGTPALAASYNAITVYAAEIITALCSDFLTPLLLIFSALSMCLVLNQTLNGEPILSMIKKGINFLLGFCSTMYTGVTAVKNVLSAGTDKVSVKGVQFILGSSVPVVGGTLSEGLSAIIASVGLMKNSLSVFGIILIIIIILPSVCELILWSGCLSVASYICEMFAQHKAASVITSIKFVISILLSVLLFCAYIFIVSTGMVILMGNK